MTQQNGSKSSAIRTVMVTLFLGLAVAGCADQGESKPPPGPGSVGGTSTAAPPDSDKASPGAGKSTARVRPGSQIPGEANYGDKPGARSQGR
jgi:hypothetical protein